MRKGREEETKKVIEVVFSLSLSLSVSSHVCSETLMYTYDSETDSLNGSWYLLDLSNHEHNSKYKYILLLSSPLLSSPLLYSPLLSSPLISSHLLSSPLISSPLFSPPPPPPHFTYFCFAAFLAYLQLIHSSRKIQMLISLKHHSESF